MLEKRQDKWRLLDEFQRELFQQLLSVHRLEGNSPAEYVRNSFSRFLDSLSVNWGVENFWHIGSGASQRLCRNLVYLARGGGQLLEEVARSRATIVSAALKW